MAMEPNLFITGFQKCGSSTLFALLSQHPEITPSKPKETFYLSDKAYENYDFQKSIYNPDSTWNMFFPPNVATSYYLEGSVCNFYQETAIQFLEKQPKAKIIFIVRDPIERFASNYKYYKSLGGFLKRGMTFQQYYQLVKNGKFKKEAMRLALAHGKYSRYIDQFIERCGEQRIYVTGFKKLLAAPQKEMNNIFTFLELPTTEDLEMVHLNKALIPRFPSLDAFMAKYLSGAGLFSKLGRKLLEPINIKTSQVKIPKWIQEELFKRYEQEYNRFSHLF